MIGRALLLFVLCAACGPATAIQYTSDPLMDKSWFSTANSALVLPVFVSGDFWVTVVSTAHPTGDQDSRYDPTLVDDTVWADWSFDGGSANATQCQPGYPVSCKWSTPGTKTVTCTVTDYAVWGPTSYDGPVTLDTLNVQVEPITLVRIDVVSGASEIDAGTGAS